VIVTEVPTTPDVTERLLITGAGTTVKLTPLLATPDTVTTMFPVVAPDGTGTSMLSALQLVGVAAVPLNLTVLIPCVAAKPDPAIVTVAPTAPEVGERLVVVCAAASRDEARMDKRTTARKKIGFQLRLRMVPTSRAL
jgi:hypothetical protein